VTSFYAMTSLACGKEKASILLLSLKRLTSVALTSLLNHKTIDLSRPGGKQFPAMSLLANQTALSQVLECQKQVIQNSPRLC